MRKNMISMRLALAIGLGNIIGAGIFVLSGTTIALAGSWALLAFVFVGILATIVALEIGELSSIMPNAKGGAYSFAYKAFGSELGFITGILLYFSFATSISVVALGFGSYLSSLFGLPSYSIQVGAIALIFALSAVNIVGIKRAAKADFGLVSTKLAILVIFIVAAVALSFYSGGFSLSNFTSGSGQAGILPIFAASIAVFFAYSGFQTISTFTSRVKGGSRAAAKAILLSVVISMAFYIAIVLALLMMAPATSYSIAADPLSFALHHVGAPYWLTSVVDLGALIATASAVLAMILSSSRIAYQIGDDHLLPKPMRRYDRKRDVAVNGVVVSAAISVVMLFSGNIYVIAAISNFGLLFSYLIASFAVIHFRKEGRNAEFRMPGYPYLTVIAILLLFAFIIAMPQESLMIGATMIIALLVIYYFFREVDDKKIVRIKLFR